MKGTVSNTFPHNLSFGTVVEDYPWTILLLSLSFTACGHGMSNSNRQTCWLMQSMLCSSWRPARVVRLRHAFVNFYFRIVFCDGTKIKHIQIPWAGPGSTCSISRPFSFSFGSLSPSFSFFNHLISPPEKSSESITVGGIFTSLSQWKLWQNFLIREEGLSLLFKSEGSRGLLERRRRLRDDGDDKT